MRSFQLVSEILFELDPIGWLLWAADLGLSSSLDVKEACVFLCRLSASIFLLPVSVQAPSSLPFTLC